FYLPVIGAKRAYVYNGKWHLLAEDGESLTLVGCPQPEQQGSNARAPLKLVEELVRKSLGRARGAGRSFEDSWQTMLDSIVEGSSAAAFMESQLSELSMQPQNGPAVAEAMIASLDRLPSSFTTPRALQTALVRLLTPQNDWLIADP